VIRASAPKAAMGSEQVVRAYKELSYVDQAFRTLKTINLHIRPIYHRLSDRVRAHVFLCVLAHYVLWHMRRLLAPSLFDDDDPAAADEARQHPVAPALRSPSAEREARNKRTADDLPNHSFDTLLEHLGTLSLNTIQVPHTKGTDEFAKVTSPTKVQQGAFDLLGCPC